MLIIMLFSKKIETNLRASKFKVNNRVRITKCKNIFSTGYAETGQEKYLLLILF